MGSTCADSLKQLLAASAFKGKHVVSVDQFAKEDLNHLFAVAQEVRRGVEREGVLDILNSRVLCTLFFEPSTRTSASFDAAIQRLGGRIIPIATQHSSTVKGESLADTVRTVACYADAIVLRHPEESSASVAAAHSPVPIINGGNGSVEHPTQAFLDMFTIREELGTLDGLTVTFVGDLKYGRPVHSLIKLLKFYDVKIQLVAPPALALPEKIRQVVPEGKLVYAGEAFSSEVVARSDVLYCTRVQKERFGDLAEYERLKDSFIVDNALLKNAKEKMIVMHPLPRNQEIHPEVDNHPGAAYFRQVWSFFFFLYMLDPWRLYVC